MATRIKRMTATLLAAATGTEADEGPLTPPTGLVWTIVELRPDSLIDNLYRGFYDTEEYHDIGSEDTDTYGKPATVAIDIIQPHKYTVKWNDEGGAGGDVKATVVIEESRQTGGAIA